MSSRTRARENRHLRACAVSFVVAFLAIVMVIMWPPVANADVVGLLAYTQSDGTTAKYSIMDLLSGSVYDLSLSVGPGSGLQWSPDAQWLTFSDASNNVYKVGADGSGLAQLTQGGSWNYPSFSPDGTQIVYHQMYGHLYTMAPDGTNKTQLPVSGASCRWLPGSKIVYTNWGFTYDSDIFVYDPPTKTETQVTHHASGEALNYATWSPDRQKLAVARLDRTTGLYDVLTMNPDGSGSVNITAGWTNSSESQPCWSPDGKYVLFQSNKSGNYDIWAMHPDGTGVVNLTNTPNVNEYVPALAPRQTVVLDWTHVVPKKIEPVKDKNGRLIGCNVKDGSMPAVTGFPDTWKSDVIQAVRKIYSDAGVDGLSITDTPTPGATTVYFTTPIDPQLRGIAYTGTGPDQFNRRPDDQAAVFISLIDDAQYVAELVAHEVGHTFGLRHINPSYDDTNKKNGQELMDYGTFRPEAFTNGIWHVCEPPDKEAGLTDITHDPVFHLLRYVSGYSSDTLAASGISPGTWDTYHSWLTTSLSFGDADMLLHDVYLFEGVGDCSSVLAHFDQITLADLGTMQFTVDVGEVLQMAAASTEGGELDTVLSIGNPTEENGCLIPLSEGNVTAYLQRLLETGQGYATVADVTVRSEIVPEPATLSLLALGALALLRRRRR